MNAGVSPQVAVARIIDLDLFPLPDVDTGRPSRRPSARRLGAGRLGAGRPFWAVMVMLLAVLTTGGGAAPPPGLTEVLSVDRTEANRYAIDPAAFYTSGSGSRSIVRRQALGDGVEQWTAEVPHNVGDVSVHGSAHVLMATADDGFDVSFLDTETGRLLWHLGEARVVSVRQGRVVFVIGGADEGPDTLRGADVRTGRTVWSHTIRDNSRVEAGRESDGAPDDIAVLDVRGRATVYAAADGAVRARTDLRARPVPWDGGDVSDFAEVTVTASRLYLSRRVGGVSFLKAYRLGDLVALWEVSGGPVGTTTDCAGLLCVADATGLHGLDPVDGRVRWSNPDWAYVDGADTGRILALDRQDEPDAALLDPRTGQVTRTLGRSVGVPGLMLRSDRGNTGMTWVGTFGTGADRLVGGLDNITGAGCSAAGRYLACSTLDGHLTVWRVPD